MALLAGATLSCVSGCTRAEEPVGRLNVLMIVADTLRADRLGCYGAERPTSPGIDAVAATGVRFARAYSTAPWTKPAVASLLTGLYPHEHGATTVFNRLPPHVPTLADVLKKRGYQTGAVVSGSFVAEKYGFGSGFDSFDEHEVLGQDHLSSQGVAGRALAFLGTATSRKAPFFLLVHFFDPHYSYIRHPDIGFAPERAGRLSEGTDIQRLRRMDLTAEEVRFLRDLYDEEIRYMDDAITRMLYGLRDHGVEDRTIIVITADHGEEFLEHGWLGHTRSMYEMVLRVPLIFSVPGWEHRGGTVLRQPVSTVAVMPTLLDLLGIGTSDLELHGESLRGLLSGTEEEEEGFAFAEVDYVPVLSFNRSKRAVKKAIIGSRYKLVRDDLTSSFELFDLESQHGERRNLAAEKPAELAELAERLARRFPAGSAPQSAAPAVKLDAAEIERLRNLGYGD